MEEWNKSVNGDRDASGSLSTKSQGVSKSGSPSIKSQGVSKSGSPSIKSQGENKKSRLEKATTNGAKRLAGGGGI